MPRKENPTAYHLIDDEKYHPGQQGESGWDTDHRGAGEFYKVSVDSRTVKSINTQFPTFRRRNITEELSGKLTFEGTFCILSSDGFYFGFWGDKGDEKEAFVLRQSEGFMYAGDNEVFATDVKWHYIKIIIDIDGGKCKLQYDGKYLPELPFTGRASSICRFEFGYGKEDLGEAMFGTDLKLYKNYLFNDSFVAKYPHDMPEDYVIETEGRATITRRPYHEASNYSICEVFGFAGSSTEITRKFDRTHGVVGYEMKYLLPKAGGTLTVSLNSAGEDVISIYDALDEIRCNGGALRKHSKNVWQTLRIEADTDTNTALIRLNGKVVSTIPFDNDAEYIDEVKIALVCNKAAHLMFTDLKAFPIPPLPADYVPEPVMPKKKGDYYVGMNICSLWRTGTHYGWDCITPFPENKPYLGYYDEGITEVADWELKWMAEHGLDFQLYCWFASDGNMPMVKTKMSSEIHDGHMLAKYSDKVKFALLWEAANGDRPESREAFRKYFVPYWIDYLFSDERYMTVDGKAIMSIFGMGILAENFGGQDAVREELEYLRSEVRKLGYKDLIIMCCGNSKPEYKKYGIDAVHAYNLGRNGYDSAFTKEHISSNMSEGSVHTVPTVSMGFNAVAWEGVRSPVLNPDDLFELLEWSKNEVLTRYDKDSWKSKLVMLSTWNEYGEGTYMMPAGVYGFGYLDALRKAFCEEVPHADLVPREEQLDRLCILHPKDRVLLAPQHNMPEDKTEYPVIKRYEFKTEEDLEKWEFFKLKDLEIKDGRLFGHSDEQDPYMILHDDKFFPISTERIGKIVANIRTYKPVNAMCCIQHQYMFEKNIWSSTQTGCVSNPECVAPLSIDPSKTNDISWHGNLYGFRFDPVWGIGDFELESIEFHEAPPFKTLKINGEIVDISFRPYEEDGTVYIPFDTKSKLKRLPNMYYEWNEISESLTVFGNKTAVFVKDSDIVTIDGVDVKMVKVFNFIDGIPHIQADILCDILGMTLKSGEWFVEIDSKK